VISRTHQSEVDDEREAGQPACRRHGASSERRVRTVATAQKRLSGTQTHPSCCSRVFVDQSAESVAALDLVWLARADEA